MVLPSGETSGHRAPPVVCVSGRHAGGGGSAAANIAETRVVMARLLGMELCFIMPSSILLRRRAFEAIGGFDEGMIRLEDYDFFWRLSAHGRVRLLETPGAMYRVHPGNFTLSVGPKSFNGDEGYRSMERFYRKLERAYANDPTKAPLVRELLAGCYAGWGKYKMQSGEMLAGRALLRDALRRHWTLKSAWRLVRSYLPAIRPLQQRSGTC